MYNNMRRKFYLVQERILEEHSPVICIELPIRDEEEQTYKVICKNILGGLLP